ncbi:MAG: integrase, partial [Gammaproteobacteria bacterium]|nr:integrase [Gammaproteobacteria bacterium]
DILTIKKEDLLVDGVYVCPNKTQNSSHKEIIFEWTDYLWNLVNDILGLQTKIKSDYLFCTRKGTPYINKNKAANGFDSKWSRLMKKAISETNLKLRFKEMDLRAKVASETSPEHARQLLGHSNQEITDRIYRRLPDRVKPFESDLWDN